MENKRLGLWAPIAVVAAALVMLAVSTGAVEAGKGGGGSNVQLSYKLYSFDDGTFKVNYMVVKSGGNMDLGVYHECYSDGQSIQSGAGRVSWSGNGNDRVGELDGQVPGGAECTGVVINFDQPATGALSPTTSGFMEVSATVSYVVQ